MSLQKPDDIMRHEDGAIDIHFYARRAAKLRRAARAIFLARMVTAAGVGGHAALMLTASLFRRDPTRRSRRAPPDPI